MDLPIVDVLIPSSGPPASLGATLASLANQRYPSFRVLATRPRTGDAGWAELHGIVRVLEARGHGARLVDTSATPLEDGPSQALLERAAAEYVLVVDDGVFLEADLLGRLVAALRASGSAFVGSSVVDLGFRDEHRPDEESIEFWDGPVRPEEIGLRSPAWARRRVHRGANMEHLRERLPRTRDRLYHVADIAGCVLYDAEKLRSVGGLRCPREADRSPSVPAAGASAAQVRLLGRYGGAGLFPSGAYRLVAAGREAASPVAGDAVTNGTSKAPTPRSRPQAAYPAAAEAGGERWSRWSRLVASRRVGAPGVRRRRRSGTER